MKRFFLSFVAAALAAVLVPILPVCAADPPDCLFTWSDQTAPASGDLLKLPSGADDPHFASLVWALDGRKSSLDNAAALLKKQPIGQRGLFLWGWNHDVYEGTPATRPFDTDKLVAASAAKTAALVKALKAAGVYSIDLGQDDNESGRCYWNLGSQADAAVAQLGVPLPAGFWDDAAIAWFNFNCATHDAPAGRAAMFQPLRDAFPMAAYGHFGELFAPIEDGQLDANGHAFYNAIGGRVAMMGNVQQPALYGGKGLLPLTQTAWGQTVFIENQLRLAAAHGPVWPWYAGDNVDNNSAWAGSPYWAEAIRQSFVTVGMNGEIFDAGQPDAARQIQAVLRETLTAAGGELPAVRIRRDKIDPAAAFFTTATADDAFWPRVIFGRVTVAAAAAGSTTQPTTQPTPVTFMEFGRTFQLTVPAGQVGAWFIWRK